MGAYTYNYLKNRYMSLERKIYKGLKHGLKPSLITEDDLLFIEKSNKGELEAFIRNKLEEEDYIPTEEDPDMKIIMDYLEEDVENEST